MDIRVEEIEPQAVVGIRGETLQTEIGDTVGRVLGQLMPRLGPNMTGAPLARYHTWEVDRGMVEVGIPVRPGTGAPEGAELSELPGGRAVVATHVGPYDKLEESWEAVGAWIKEHDLTARAAPWEQYESDCSQVPPEALVTRIIWPID